MITKLPKQVESRLAEFRDKWVRIGLSTERVQREEVESAMAKVYAGVGKPRPRHVIMLRSPREVILAVALLRSKSAEFENSAQVSDQVIAQVRAQVRAQVSDQVIAQVSDQVIAQVIDQVSAQVIAQVRDQVSDQVIAQVRDQVSDQVIAQVRDILRFWWYDFGQFDAYFCAFYEVMGELGVDVSRIECLKEYTRAAGYSVFFWEWAFVSDRPTLVKRDEQNRLHSLEGPALAYPDGFSIYAVHGVRVPQDLIEDRKSITVDRIQKESNAEIRRVMIELYGQAKYLIDSGAKQIHADDFGVLYRQEIPGDEPLVMVKVANSTPEADGTFKDYFLRVPPTMKRARQAIAWTFGKEEEEYAPAVET